MIRVLIVEDRPEFADLLSRFLSEAGCETNIVGSVEDAIRFAGKVNIITLDLNLGEGHGADDTIPMIHEIAAAHPDSLIIIISGVVTATDTQRLLDAGAHGFIHKLDMPTLRTFGGSLLGIFRRLTSSPPKMLHNVENVERMATHFAEWTKKFSPEPTAESPNPK